MANTLKFGNGEWYGKKDTILAYNDLNSNFKPLPFNFSRDSSATVVNKDGLIETVSIGQPRIDYKDDSKGTLLLEPQRTNLIAYSEDFSDVSWSKTDSTISLNQDISPDGTNNASLLSTVGEGRLRINFTPPSTVRTFSIWVKSYNNIQSNGYLTFSGLNSIGFTTTNEWQRITTTRDVVGDEFKCSLRTTDSSLLVWGAQLEEGSYATSYIPTQGSIVTRLADVCNNGGNEQVMNSTEGVLYAEISALSDDGTFRQISLNDATNNNVIQIDYTSTDNQIRGVVLSGGVLVTVLPFISSDVTLSYKIALKYKSNDFSLWVNGVEVSTDSNGVTPTNLSALFLSNGVGTNNFYGNVKDLRVYNTVLTNAELQALTT